MSASRFEEFRQKLVAFMDEAVYPAEADFASQPLAEPWGRPPVLDRLREEARRRGLFHLFSVTRASEFSFSTSEIARLVEITGRSPMVAADAIGSLNPDCEVINLLHHFGTAEQKARWLEPLRAGTIGSALCITEPEVASSDPTTLRVAAVDDGNGFVVDGRKSWALGALSPICELIVLLAATDPAQPPKGRYSLLLVPRRSAGIEVGESASFYGFRNEFRGGMPVVEFKSVRVPADALLGPRGQGFATAQTSLGPARLYHCMRLVGAGERALGLLRARLKSRLVGGRPLAENALWMDRLAEARIRIEQARALTLSVADLADREGLKAASTQISLAKAAVPASIEWVVDTAIQAHGSDGMSDSLPLATLWAMARTLRFSDGPDEVHRMVVARAELKQK